MDQFYTSPYDWALREAPTSDHASTLILMVIADTPDGERHHCISYKDITGSLSITEQEASEKINVMVRAGMIIIDPDLNPNISKTFDGASCLLNTYVVKGGAS